MRPGFLVGVFAFGVALAAASFLYSRGAGYSEWQAAKIAFLLFLAVTVLPVPISVLWTKRRALRLPGRGLRREAETALLVFCLLAAAAVVILVIVAEGPWPGAA